MKRYGIMQESGMLRKAALAAALAAAWAGSPVMGADAPRQVQTVFVIALENHNWTQPNGNVDIHSKTLLQLKGNPVAPFINSLIDGTSSLSPQVSYTDTYHNALATPSGHNRSVHPSELSYIWSEAGSDLGVHSDADPYMVTAANGVSTFVGNNQNMTNHLSSFLSRVGIDWRSYQEDIDLLSTDGSAAVNHPPRDGLTSQLAPRERWTVPIATFEGHSEAYTNPYNGTHQYGYAAKHNPMVFFTDTNGGDTSKVTPQAAHYAPLQQLFIDLKSGAASRYNWITPNLYNDMHSPLKTDVTISGVRYAHDTDAAQIAVADHFLAQVIPQIVASDPYRNGGAIIIWSDETEHQDEHDQYRNDFQHTLPCIVISPLAHPNVAGKPYAANAQPYSHSSFLRTMQEIYNVGPYLGDAAEAHDLSDLFVPGAVPSAVTRIVLPTGVLEGVH